MKVNSKFLSAEVRITAATLDQRKLIIEGLIKEFMPISVELEFEDLLTVAQHLLRPIRQWVAQYLP